MESSLAGFSINQDIWLGLSLNKRGLLLTINVISLIVMQMSALYEYSLHKLKI